MKRPTLLKLAQFWWLRYHQNDDTCLRAKSRSLPTEVHAWCEKPYVVVKVVHANGEEPRIGIARCSPDDRFCQKTGLRLALKRALLERRVIGYVEAFAVEAGDQDIEKAARRAWS